MLVGVVIIAGVLSLGFGYAALARWPGSGVTVWDAAFLVSASVFLGAFVRLIVSQAAATLIRSHRHGSGRRRP